jgi:hypothetical protein
MPQIYRGTKYKCRLCGKIFYGNFAVQTKNDILKAEIGLEHFDTYADPWFPRMTIIHQCDEDNIGIADLLGFVDGEWRRDD